MIATVKHKLGDSLNIAFQETVDGPILFNQYIKRDDWEFDPDGCTAKVARFLKNIAPVQVAEVYDNIEKSYVEMTEEQVTAKLAAIDEAEAIKKADAESKAENSDEVNENPEK